MKEHYSIGYYIGCRLKEAKEREVSDILQYVRYHQK